MTVQFLHRSAIDTAKWDECMAASDNGEVYGNRWFLDLIAKDWHGLILDDYVALMPIVTGKKMGLSYMYQPPFFQRTSIFTRIKLMPETVNLFYAAIPAHFKLQEFNVDSNSLPGASCAYEIHVRPNLILSLASTYAELQKAFSTNTKRNIKKAEKQGLKIGLTQDPLPMIESYRTHRGKLACELTDSDFERLEKLIRSSLLNKYGELMEARTKDGIFAGGIFILKGYKRHILLFMGANAPAKESGAMFALIDTYLKKNAETDAFFDFEGSEDQGVARFYAGFGTFEEKYYALKKDRLNKLISFAKRLIR